MGPPFLKGKRKMIPLILLVIVLPICCRIKKTVIPVILTVIIALPWIFLDIHFASGALGELERSEKSLDQYIQALKDEFPSIPTEPSQAEVFLLILPFARSLGEVSDLWNDHDTGVSLLKYMNKLTRPSRLLFKGPIDELSYYVPDDSDIEVIGTDVKFFGGSPNGFEMKLMENKERELSWKN